MPKKKIENNNTISKEYTKNKLTELLEKNADKLPNAEELKKKINKPKKEKIKKEETIEELKERVKKEIEEDKLKDIFNNTNEKITLDEFTKKKLDELIEDDSKLINKTVTFKKENDNVKFEGYHQNVKKYSPDELQNNELKISYNIWKDAFVNNPNEFFSTWIKQYFQNNNFEIKPTDRLKSYLDFDKNWIHIKN